MRKKIIIIASILITVVLVSVISVKTYHASLFTRYFVELEKVDQVIVEKSNGEFKIVTSSDILHIFTKYKNDIKYDKSIFFITKGIQMYVYISDEVSFVHNGMGACKILDGSNELVFSAPNEMHYEINQLLGE